MNAVQVARQHYYRHTYKTDRSGKRITTCKLKCIVYAIRLCQFADGESDSEFVFICEHPRELAVKFPIRGKHKICKFCDANYFCTLLYVAPVAGLA